MTTPERFARLRGLFEQAVERPATEWLPFLLEACPDDRRLRDEVLGLLHADASPDLGLDAPTPDVLSGLFDDPSLSMVGRRVGHYEISRVIGFGGMGAVYEAHRADDQFRKTVAIKLIKRGMDTELTIRRFRHERQILASLDHRNIAGLLDGGVTDDGRPYFVMEYVTGSPITTYCQERGLSIRDRVQLFRQVCAAVQYAHQNLVVHRDLKPGNILVSSDGTVKLLDFGIAKILGEEADPENVPVTRGGFRALTPEYASPEMIRGEPISVAADVYSLGVVLFELLTGRRPFRFGDRTMASLEEAILSDPVPKPSASVLAPQDETPGPGNRVGFARALSGEVDNIVLMALRKEPARRYPSAEAFGQDIKRWLEGLPIVAEPDWFGYRARKFVGRNALAVTSGVALIGTLVGGIVLTARQATRADRERRKAERVTQFLAGILAAPEPSVQRPDITVAELLDSASARADRGFSAEPDVQALVQATIGHSYLGIGRYSKAEGAFRSALGAAERSGADLDERLIAINNVASALLNTNQLAAADSAFNYGLTLHRQSGRAPDTTEATLLDNLGSVALRLGNLDSAISRHTVSLALRRQLRPGDHDEVARSITNLAVVLTTAGKHAPAESMHREALAMMTRLHGQNHTYTAAALLGLAGSLDYQGKPGADTLYQEVLRIRAALLGRDHPDYAWTLYLYGNWQLDHHRDREALDLFHQVVALRGKTLTDDHPIVAATLNGIGRALATMGRYGDAEKTIHEAIAIRRANLPPGHWAIISSELALAEVQLKAKRYREAEPAILSAYQRLLAAVGPGHTRVRDARADLVTLFEQTNRPHLADPYRQP